MRTCARCGRELQRHPGETDQQFARRRYCSWLCKRRGALRQAGRDRCECGAPATHVARFQQFSSEMHVQRAELLVCEACGREMVKDDKRVKLEPLPPALLEVADAAE